MNYPPLTEVRSSLRVKWYRCPIEAKVLRELLKRNDRQGYIQAGGHIGLWLLTGALVYVCWAQQSWLIVVALFAHGTVSSFFSGVAPHELGHGTVFRTPVLNRFFLYLFSLISWWDPFDYACSHTYHHRFTLHPEGDRENLLPLAPNTSRGFLLQMVTVNLFTQRGRTFGKGGLLSTLYITLQSALGRAGSPDIPSDEWLIAIRRDQPGEFRKSILWSRLLLTLHGVVVLLSIASGQWIFIFIVTLSPFIANLLSYLVGMTQHCGLKENDTDFRKSVRSVVLNPVAEFLYWHMNWHTEHHMFAGVPCYNLKKLHAAVRADMPRPRTLREAWSEMLATWRQQKVDPNYFFDTPVPPPAKSNHGIASTEIEESIGDLAPEGLRESP